MHQRSESELLHRFVNTDVVFQLKKYIPTLKLQSHLASVQSQLNIHKED